MTSLQDLKRRLRRDIRRRRKSVSSHDRAVADSAIQHKLSSLLAQLQPSAVCAYSPMPNEPGGADLPFFIAGVLPSDAPLFLPRVVPHTERTMEWVEFDGHLATSEWGIAEPTGRAVPNVFLKEPLMILPALAIDYDGRRLGQGGGFYDTMFATMPTGIISCAIVDDVEILDHVPAEDHDLVVDYIISGATVVQRKGK